MVAADSGGLPVEVAAADDQDLRLEHSSVDALCFSKLLRAGRLSRPIVTRARAPATDHPARHRVVGPPERGVERVDLRVRPRGRFRKRRTECVRDLVRSDDADKP